MRLLVALCGVLALFAATASKSEDASVSPHFFPLNLVQNSRLQVAASINGHPVIALLDSAAESTFLDRRFAKRIDMGKGQSVVGQGSGKSAFQADLVDGVTIEAFGVTIPGQTVAVADLSDVGRRLLRHRLDAILGREIFDAARLIVDIDSGRIGVLPRSSEPAGVKLTSVTEHGVETIPVQVESGEVVRATFDLGNGADVLISHAFALRTHLLNDGRPVTTTRGGGLGGETSRQVLELRSIEIAGRRFDNVRAAIDPQSSASEVNVGVRLLRHFLITTDFAQHTIWLQPRNEPGHSS